MIPLGTILRAQAEGLGVSIDRQANDGSKTKARSELP